MDLPDPEIKPGTPSLQADSLPNELPGHDLYIHVKNAPILGKELGKFHIREDMGTAWQRKRVGGSRVFQCIP